MSFFSSLLGSNAGAPDCRRSDIAASASAAGRGSSSRGPARSATRRRSSAASEGCALSNWRGEATIAMGVPPGIGPEIVMRALARRVASHICRPLVVGDRARLERAGAIVNSTLSLHAIAAPKEATFSPRGRRRDRPSRLARRSSLRQESGDRRRGGLSVRRENLRARGAGEVDAICTAPLSQRGVAYGRA